MSEKSSLEFSSWHQTILTEDFGFFTPYKPTPKLLGMVNRYAQLRREPKPFSLGFCLKNIRYSWISHPVAKEAFKVVFSLFGYIVDCLIVPIQMGGIWGYNFWRNKKIADLSEEIQLEQVLINSSPLQCQNSQVPDSPGVSFTEDMKPPSRLSQDMPIHKLDLAKAEATPFVVQESRKKDKTSPTDSPRIPLSKNSDVPPQGVVSLDTSGPVHLAPYSFELVDKLIKNRHFSEETFKKIMDMIETMKTLVGQMGEQTQAFWDLVTSMSEKFQTSMIIVRIIINLFFRADVQKEKSQDLRFNAYPLFCKIFANQNAFFHHIKNFLSDFRSSTDFSHKLELVNFLSKKFKTTYKNYQIKIGVVSSEAPLLEDFFGIRVFHKEEEKFVEQFHFYFKVNFFYDKSEKKYRATLEDKVF